MSDSTDKYESEAERHRSNVDDTIEALRDKFSPGQLVDEAMSYLRNGDGAKVANNLGRQVRDNPLALGLIGAGIAWLAFGSGTRGGDYPVRSDAWRRYKDNEDAILDDEYDDDDPLTRPVGRSSRTPIRAYSGPGGSSVVGESDFDASTARRSTADFDPRTGEAGYVPPSNVDWKDGDPGDGKSFGDRASSAFHDAEHRVAGAYRSGSRSVRRYGHDRAAQARRFAHETSENARHAGHSAAEAVRGAGENAAGAAEAASNSARQAYEDGVRAAQRNFRSVSRQTGKAYGRARDEVVDAFRNEPIVFGALAIAVGAAIGAALPPTRREDEYFGETRDHLRDDAYRAARDAGRDAQDIAEKTYLSASDRAEEKGLKPAGGGSETFAKKVSDVARTAAETAEDETKKKL